jgi:hypothetical protein
MQIKIIFKNETKKIKFTDTYDNLVQQTGKAFGDLPLHFKFFYMDSECDMISISSQDDFEEALECM